MAQSSGIASKTAVALVLLIVVIGAGSYALWSYEAAQSNYSYAFSVSIVYSGTWQMTYYGFHRVVPSDPFSGTGNFTGGVFVGGGSATKAVVLSGPKNSGLTLCVVAQKSDSSNDMLTLNLGSRFNTTSFPHGRVSLCLGVVP